MPRAAARNHRPPAEHRPRSRPGGSYAIDTTDLRRPRRGGPPRPVRLLATLLCLVLLFYVGLAVWGAQRIDHVDALSGAPDTPGTTWLLAGSDRRDAAVDDPTEGNRADTIMLFHRPDNGSGATLVALPRDSYVEVPGYGPSKLNASFSLGGPELLVATVEEATGITVDHFADVGFGGFVGLTDAVGGVQLCPEQAIADPMSGLDVAAGCQDVDGTTALAYVRARYFDPRGDLGRIERQQEFLGALVGSATSPGTLLNPVRQVRLVRAATDAVEVDQDTGMLDLAGMGLAFRSALGGGGTVTTVPISDPDYRPGGVGSTVRWDEEGAAALFADLLAGNPVAPVVG